MPKPVVASGANAAQWCFAWVPKVKGRTRAAVLKDARWPPGAIITIGFLDGKPAVKERVAAAARGWLGPGRANLGFVFKARPDGCAIRISFKHPGSWSMIGTHCLGVPHDQATMNYGWLTPGSTDDEVERVVLHEFGHALGLIHEHQSPRGAIKWNRPVIYKELSGPPNRWSKATIDTNMFDTFPRKAVAATKLDPTSIMMYPFPARWTLDGSSTGLNSTLSPRDRKLIRAIYP